MGKGKKIGFSLIIAIILIIIALVGTYFISFRPTITTTPISQTLNINKFKLLKEILPDNIELNSSGISATSNIRLTSSDLTNLTAYALSVSPTIEKYVKGVQIGFENNKIILYTTVQYLGIPVQAKIILIPSSKDGSGILHYESGSIGFLSLPQNYIFNELSTALSTNDYIQIDPITKDIIINFKTLKQLKINSFKIENDSIDLTFNGRLNF
ncbi:MAG: DUF2140 family protein [Sarcina sp.]